MFNPTNNPSYDKVNKLIIGGENYDKKEFAFSLEYPLAAHCYPSSQMRLIAYATHTPDTSPVILRSYASRKCLLRKFFL